MRTDRAERKTQRRLSVAVIVCLFVFAAARFTHDVRELVYPLNDLTPVWVSSKAFVAGNDPYGNMQALQTVWASARLGTVEGCANYACVLQKYPMAYPPSALPLLAFFSLTTFPVAVLVYLVASVAFFISVVLLLTRQLPLPWTSARKWLFLALALALSPIHAGIHHSNLNTLVISLLVLSAALLGRGPRASGLALGLSLCIKPQVGWLFFVLLLWRRQWTAAITAFGTGLAITAASVCWLSLHHVEVVRSYRDSLDRFMPAGGINSFSMSSPQKYTMIHLQVLIYQMIPNAEAANLIAWLTFASLTLVAAFLLRSRSAERQSVTLALVSVLTLLPVYQQIYTAAVLVFVLYWAIEHWYLAQAKAAVMLMLALLLPLASMTWTSAPLAAFVARHHLSSYILWNAFIMPHVIWTECTLALLMMSTILPAYAGATSNQQIVKESVAQ